MNSLEIMDIQPSIITSKNLMNKKIILLVGGSGMVGRNLLDHPEINRFDLLAPNSKELDLRDLSATESYLKKIRPEMIIHAAGKVGGIQANLREPVSFLLENLDIGRNLIWASFKAEVKQLINLGSSCMYPRNHFDALREEQILQGELESSNEGYALAKIVTAKLCDYISRENVTYQYKTLIPCNIYGPHDKFDPAHSHLVPAIIHKVHQAKERGAGSVEIWGDGLARREFMYAGDLANAIISAIDNFETLPNYMNVGLGKDFSINEYYQAAKDVMGYSGKFIHNLSKPVGMARKLVNVEKQTKWGWSPQTDLRSGLKKTYEYYLRKNTA
jgi:GDP-L-fucose synthase